MSFHAGVVAGLIVGGGLGVAVTIALFHLHDRLDQRRPVPFDDTLEALKRLR